MYTKASVKGVAVACVGVLMALNVMSARAENNSSASAYQGTLTGDWGGLRTKLHDHGVDLSLDVLVQPTTNLRGGVRHNTTWPDQEIFGATFDFGRMTGGGAGSLGSLNVLIVQRNGHSLDFSKAQLGTLLPSQNAFGLGQYTHLTNFYYEKSIFKNALDVKVGRMFWQAAGFYPYPCKFQSLVFCGGLPTYITQGINNIANSQDGVAISIHPQSAWYLNLGWFKVNPSNTEKAHAWNIIAPGHNIGTLTSAEFGVHTDLGGSRSSLDGLWAVGAWHNSARFPDLLQAVGRNGELVPLADAGIENMITHTTSGTYFYGQQRLSGSAARGGAVVFATIVNSDGQTDKVDRMEQIGVMWKGLVRSRPNDAVHFAVGRMHLNPRFTMAQELDDVPTSFVAHGYEYESELDYSIALPRGISIMPNLQYIYHPGGVPANSSVVLFGVQANVVF